MRRVSAAGAGESLLRVSLGRYLLVLPIHTANQWNAEREFLADRHGCCYHVQTLKSGVPSPHPLTFPRSQQLILYFYFHTGLAVRRTAISYERRQYRRILVKYSTCSTFQSVPCRHAFRLHVSEGDAKNLPCKSLGGWRLVQEPIKATLIKRPGMS